MNSKSKPGVHSLEVVQSLKNAALPTHGENFDPPSEISRRTMLKLMMSASAALTVGISGCERKPRRRIISRVGGPEYDKPGLALHYASTWTDGSYPYGVLIKTLNGRPIKIEGNPDHPVNRGASDAAMQASLLSLYDPDRLREPMSGNQAAKWEAVDLRVIEALRTSKSTVLLSRATLGPSERELFRLFLEIHPQAKHFVYESAHDEPRRAAWRKLYGSDSEWLPRYDRARIIVSLDCDFLGTDGVVLENIRTFAEGRRLRDEEHQNAKMSRLYAIESTMTVTGSNADHHLRLRPSAMAELANALRTALAGDESALYDCAAKYHLDKNILEALVADLHAHPEQAVVVAGGHLPPTVHEAVACLNDALAAPGNTLEWNPQTATLPVSSISYIEAALDAGPDVLICLGVNPFYDWPGKDFKAFLGKVKLSVAHSQYLDETAAACALALPSCHYLESWNDAEPRPGINSLCQPVIAPLFDSRQEAETLLLWTQALAQETNPIRKAADWHDFIKERWMARLSGANSAGGAGVVSASATTQPQPESPLQIAWETCLRTGGDFKPVPSPAPKLKQDEATQVAEVTPNEPASYEIVIRPHPGVYDGRFANNGWLQEWPDPVSKLVWDNAAALSPNTAAKLGVAEGDLVTIQVGGRSITLPALIQRGAADDVVALTLGHGRTAGGKIALEAAGVNVAPLLGQTDPAVPRLLMNARLVKAAGNRRIVRIQKEFSMHGRPIVLDGTLEEFRHEVDFVKHKRHLPEMVNLYEPYDYSKNHKWALAIDLGACVGCGACMTACQAENNVAIVGREECEKGREMHWLRIDRYEDGDPNDPAIHNQPMLCQHCDQAPCENVCPVNATTHSPEGLNEMTYNRCVGTRYCANNCPYKVRRFNFLRWHEARLHDPVQELVFNPQVTVRGVGVMEKCTFCVQRINAGKYAAQNKNQKLADGAIQTACQQACPAQAIIFGDVNDPESAISKARASGRQYHVLEELNIKPNVTYLARVRNPIPTSTGEAPTPSGSQHG